MYIKDSMEELKDADAPLQPKKPKKDEKKVEVVESPKKSLML